MLDIRSNVDVISSIQEDLCRVYANKALYVGVSLIHRLGYPRRIFESISHGYQGLTLFASLIIMAPRYKQVSSPRFYRLENRSLRGLEMYLGYTGKYDRDMVIDAILYRAEPAYTLLSA